MVEGLVSAAAVFIGDTVGRRLEDEAVTSSMD
jgi:hypothetical protein